MSIKYFSIILLLLSSFLWAQEDEAQLRILANSPLWRRLLHIDQRRYLPNGDKILIEPLLELKKTIQLFREQTEVKLGIPAQYPECAYISRYLFLKEHLKLPDKRACPEYDQWIKSLNPKSISLILASPYAHHPASLFGHTFFKIETDYHSSNSDLLSYGINYSAITDTDNGLVFALLGLTGGYQGHFSLMPYFLKLNEYSYMESRDLWEYKLNIPKTKIDFLISHIWELESNGYFKYYFMDENCSYQLLKLLEIIYPELDLTSHFKVFVPPIDTIKVLYKHPELITDINYRPSIFTKVKAHFEKLDRDQKQLFLNSLNQLTEATLQKINDTKVLDLIIEYLEYKKDKSPIFLSLLKYRAKFSNPKEEVKIIPPAVPHKSHDISKIGTSLSVQKEQKPKFAFLYKVGFHDLYNPKNGYPSLTELNILETKIFYQNNHLAFDYLDIINVTALNPNDFNQINLSWLANLKVVRNAVNSKVAMGNTYSHFKNQTFALLLGPYLNVGDIPKHFEMGAYFHHLILGEIAPNLKYITTVSYAYLKKEKPLLIDLKLIYQLNTNQDIIISGQNDKQLELSTNLYF